VAGPRISVVIPVKNRADCLRDLFRQLDSQTLPSDQFEVLVVDDASGDCSREVIGSWVAAAPSRRRLVEGLGRGPAYARNLGIRKACGKWIAFTDSDTIPDPTWLVAALEAVGRRRVKALEGSVEPWPPEAVAPNTHQIDTGSGGRYMTANMIYHRHVLERVGGFDEQFTAPFLEDSDLAFRVMDAGFEIAYAPEVRVRHRVERRSFVDVHRSAMKLRWIALLARKHPERYRTQLRPVVRPLSHVDVDVLLGLLAAAATLRAPGLPRVVLGIVAANGIRRGLSSSRVLAGPIEEMPRQAALALSLPVSKMFWWLEGCSRFRNLVW
jgi:glycosyltransferase involved in cell wall biosynthesis